MNGDRTSPVKIVFSAALAGLLCSNGVLNAAPLMQNLTSAGALGAGAKRASGEQAAGLGQDSFNALMEMPVGAQREGASAVAGSAESSRASGLGSGGSRAMSGARSAGASVPSASSEETGWNPKAKGGEGFRNGFWKGFNWLETPAALLDKASFDCGGGYIPFCAPSDSFLIAAPAEILTFVVLAAPAAVVGLATGLFGAIFGARDH